MLRMFFLLIIGMLWPAFCDAANESISSSNKADTESNHVQASAKTDANGQQQSNNTKALASSRWRNLRKDMSETQVRGILGAPLLIQASSEKSVWFYQQAPELVDKYEMPGTVIFCAQSYNVTMLKERENQRYITDLRNLLRSSKATVRSVSTGAGLPGGGHRADIHGPTGKETDYVDDKRLGELARDPGNFTIPYQTRNTDPKRKKDAEILTNQFKANFAIGLQKINDAHDQRMKVLASDLQPRSVEFVVQMVNEPDWNGQTPDSTVKVALHFDGKRKWERPSNWRMLKINMTQREVESILGEPSQYTPGVADTVYYYGESPEAGMVTLAVRQNSDKRASSWQEPFWPDVQKRLTNDAEKSSASNTSNSNVDANQKLSARNQK